MDHDGAYRAPFTLLRPSGDRLHLHWNHLVLSTGLDGFIRGGEQGLFADEARVLSVYRWLIDDVEPYPCGVAATSARESLGYYVAFPPDRPASQPDSGSGLLREGTQQTLALEVLRHLVPGDAAAGGVDRIEESLVVSNYSDAPAACTLRLLVDADFLSLPELRGRPLHLGTIARAWDAATRTLRYRWTARQHFAHDGERGDATDRREITVSVTAADGAVTDDGEALAFPIALAPLAQWHARLTLTPSQAHAVPTRRTQPRHGTMMTVDVPGDHTRSATIAAVLAQACRDLVDLRLPALDDEGGGWTMSAGVPLYVALFGRDTLTAAWQAGMLTPAMMRGSLSALAALQGQRRNDWRDEAPGRLLHEAHTGPLEALRVNPRSRYYGSVTTSGFFPLVLSEYWHWTADDDFVRAMVPRALEALRWLDEEGDLDGDGFVEYLTRSADGVRHQGWKDSADAIVYPDGQQVEPPIATAEEQAFVYVAKLHFAEVLWRLGERREARRLFREARRLRRRFGEAFWLPDAGFIAMALDAGKRPVASVGSHAGHCLAAGILRREHARAVADRLLAPDMFSGWGIRTLSSAHPAYNPFSYHRGTVWPVEQGSFALGFLRYGLHEHVQRLAAAVFDAASLFEHVRLPELFGGQPRDDAHPFPALYPQANAPQAWSASTVFLLLQGMLGLYPYAPSRLLFVDPHLPAWFPECVLRDLHVGAARVTLHFTRQPSGDTTFRVVDRTGSLHVIQQASPWSLTEPFGRRVRTLLGV